MDLESIPHQAARYRRRKRELLCVTWLRYVAMRKLEIGFVLRPQLFGALSKLRVDRSA